MASYNTTNSNYDSSGLLTNSSPGYAMLGTYNMGTQWTAPQAFAPSMATVVVPTFGAPGYDTLLHNQAQPSGGGYFNIMTAYPSFAADQCTAFSSRMCS